MRTYGKVHIVLFILMFLVAASVKGSDKLNNTDEFFVIHDIRYDTESYSRTAHSYSRAVIDCLHKEGIKARFVEGGEKDVPGGAVLVKYMQEALPPEQGAQRF